MSGRTEPGAAVSDRAAIDAAAGGLRADLSASDLDRADGGGRDPKAVVDSDGRCGAIAGLRVVDASIWPDVPSVATGFPTMMLAERIASNVN